MNKYKLTDDKQRFCAARIITRTIIENHFKIDKNKIEILLNKYGKPYLNNSKDLFFNISHSGDWVVVGFANMEIGVDIQKISTSNKIDIDNIAKHAFHTDEIQYLQNSSKNTKRANFYKIWSLKEALVKAKGLGFYENLDKLSVIPIINNTSKLLDNLSFSTKHLDENHILSVSVATSSPISIAEHDFREFL